MQIQQYLWKIFQKHNIGRFVAKVSVVLVGLLLTGATVGTNLHEAQATFSTRCAVSDRSYSVVAGDTLGKVAARYGMSWSALAKYNHIANAHLIYTHQLLCIPHTNNVSDSHAPNAQTVQSALARSSKGGTYNSVGQTTGHNSVGSTGSNGPVGYAHGSVGYAGGNGPIGHTNVFPYGACTWWADQRYYQLHGFFVPWTSQANAWQWVTRAYQYGWHVSSFPAVGDIMVLQPGVQGAYWLGHVAVVERVLSNGQVIASSMSWGSRPLAVTTWQFTPGPGVAFVTR